MRLKNLFFVLIVAVLLISVSSCKKVVGEGPLLTEARSRGHFTGIDVRISGDIQFVKDSVYKIEVTAQQNLLNEIETHIMGNNLVIKFRDGIRVRSHERISLLISAPEISLVRLSGSGNIAASGEWQTRNFSLDLSGSGNIIMHNLTADYLDGKISGSGNVTVLAGKVQDATLKISGSGNMDLLNMEARSIFTSTSGSGSMKVSVSELLNVTISGSGSVYYRGNPLLSTRISGSGKVFKL